MAFTPVSGRGLQHPGAIPRTPPEPTPAPQPFPFGRGIIPRTPTWPFPPPAPPAPQQGAERRRWADFLAYPFPPPPAGLPDPGPPPPRPPPPPPPPDPPPGPPPPGPPPGPPLLGPLTGPSASPSAARPPKRRGTALHHAGRFHQAPRGRVQRGARAPAPEKEASLWQAGAVSVWAPRANVGSWVLSLSIDIYIYT